MGRNLFCDLCRKSVPLDSALQEVMIGVDVNAEVCLNCASSLNQGINQQMQEAQRAVLAAQKAAEQPAPVTEAPAAPKEPAAPEEVKDIKEKLEQPHANEGM